MRLGGDGVGVDGLGGDGLCAEGLGTCCEALELEDALDSCGCKSFEAPLNCEFLLSFVGLGGLWLLVFGGCGSFFGLCFEGPSFLSLFCNGLLLVGEVDGDRFEEDMFECQHEQQLEIQCKLASLYFRANFTVSRGKIIVIHCSTGQRWISFHGRLIRIEA